VKPLFGTKLPEEFFKDIDFSDMKIFVDTREQQPLVFENQSSMKLDFGDYTASGEYYDYTYVDRKSGNDFIGTLSLGNLDRFRREIGRAQELNSYIFIVIESSLQKLEAYMRAAKNQKFGPHKTNLNFIYHNMREISHEFSDCCQFVFAGSRENSQDIIKRILFFGRKIWNSDLQYYIDKNVG
jgi:ERCC4-type nuclease